MDSSAQRRLFKGQVNLVRLLRTKSEGRKGGERLRVVFIFLCLVKSKLSLEPTQTHRHRAIHTYILKDIVHIMYNV